MFVSYFVMRGFGCLSPSCYSRVGIIPRNILEMVIGQSAAQARIGNTLCRAASFKAPAELLWSKSPLPSPDFGESGEHSATTGISMNSGGTLNGPAETQRRRPYCMCFGMRWSRHSLSGLIRAPHCRGMLTTHRSTFSVSLLDGKSHLTGKDWSLALALCSATSK